MNELIQQLISQVGINEGQAKGGAGLLFKLAQEKLGGDFSKITDAIGSVKDLTDAAPETGGGLAGLAGGLLSAAGAGKFGALADLAGGFKKLDLDPDLIGKFVPIIVSFLQSKGGAGVADLIAKALK
jgi:hypothetical protein